MKYLVLELAVALVALLVFFLSLAMKPERKRDLGYVVGGGLLAIFLLSFFVETGGGLFGGAYLMDGLALFAKQLFLVASFLCVLGSLALPIPTFERRAAEYYLLLLASLLGMMILASARELILLFVAFELMSIPLYVLAGFLKREPEAVEASLKFFLVGSLSTAILAYGLSFIYGVTGTTQLDAILKALKAGHPLLLLGMILTLAGFGFKIAAVPFHMWAPDTYEAAATPYVAWLSVAPKAAGFVAIFRVYLEGLSTEADRWAPYAAVLAAITIVAGNLMALPQRNVKRLLAYSGIAHIGYMLLGLAAVSTYGAAMILFYLVTYVFSNMGAFLVVEAIIRSEGSEDLNAFRGLAQRSPLLALAMLLFLLSLGGIPFMAGFWAKLYVFWAAAQAGRYGLVLLGAVMTVVALYYYLMVAKRMYIEPPERAYRIPVEPSLGLALVISALAVVLIGLYPRPLLDATLAVAASLF